jgi:hypothetical protein
MGWLLDTNLEEIWRAIRTAAALVIYELSNEWAKSSHVLDSFAKAHQFDEELLQWVVRGCVFAFCVILVGVVEGYLRRTATQRERNQSGLKKFEGAWAQSSSIAARPYSLSVIRFSDANQRWEYFGVGFTKDFKPAAEWQTLSLFYDKPRREWFFGGPAWLRSFDDTMKKFPRTGGQGSVTPILQLPSNPSVPFEGIVADFDIGQSPGPFRITLFPVDARHKRTFSDVPTLLKLESDEVRRILSDSGVDIP